MGDLNFGDIQGNILRGYNFSAGSHYFVGVPDGMRGRALLRTLLPELTTARSWGTPPLVAVNVALTFAGLKKLGVEESILSLLPPAFREPIRHRAQIQLGDDPDEWDDEFGNGETHLLILLATSEQAQIDDAFEWRFPKLRRARGWLDGRLRDHAARLLHRQDVEARPAAPGRPTPREHFGYADGFGQPAIEGLSNNWPGQGVPELETKMWRDIKAGEFILGHPNEDGGSVPALTTWLLYDGSFMVYRKLEQDVAAFRRVVAAQARLYEGYVTEPLTTEEARELTAAKLVGRWRDGTALELDAGPRQDRRVKTRINSRVDNNFCFLHDPEGRSCPLGAHIRRANPRDLIGRDHQESARHRIIRRAMPYGPAYDGPADGHEEAGHGQARPERGLIFICFNADFERQFEVVQGQWLGDGSTLGLAETQDYLVGNRRDGKLAIGGKSPFFATRDERLVRTRGCEYLLMPGLAALERLAARPSGAMRLEQIPAKEPNAIHEVVEAVSTKMHRTYAGSSPMLRGQHPKAHACVKAEFIVEDVPEGLRIGVFDVKETRTYDAWIRFSASHPGLRSDAHPDAQGIAVKLLGVDGEKLMPHERWAMTQDFILVSHETFFLRNAMDVAHFARAVTPTGSVRGLGARGNFHLGEFFFRDRRSFGIVRKMIAAKPDNPLDVTYWSETPYALGNRAVKYMVRPEREVGRAGARPDDWDSLEDAMEEALKPKDAEFRFEFLVQRQGDPYMMPVENPMIRWDDREAPFRKVATIRITHQHFTLQYRRNFGENLMFTPWHSRFEHRPLGGVNRLRRWVYEASSYLRHDRNGAPYTEPGGLVGLRPPCLWEWLYPPTHASALRR